MRCLKPQVDARPASALAVAAALPGGDPLAAALAAGETPSPEMVAAAGSAEVLHPAIGLALVAATVIGLLALAALGNRTILFNYVPMQRSLDSLEDRAREIAGLLGYDGPGDDSARGLQVNYEYLSDIFRTDKSSTRWHTLTNRQVPAMLFWYRSSPEALVPLAPEWIPLLSDPPSTVAGMTTVVLDDAGRLMEFRGVPPLRDTAPAGPPDAAWSQLFSAAALPFSQFRPAEPDFVPRGYADQRAAWEGPFREGSTIRVRVDAASYRGRAVFFRVTGPWTPTERAATSSSGRNPSVWRFAGSIDRPPPARREHRPRTKQSPRGARRPSRCGTHLALLSRRLALRLDNRCQPLPVARYGAGASVHVPRRSAVSSHQPLSPLRVARARTCVDSRPAF